MLHLRKGYSSLVNGYGYKYRYQNRSLPIFRYIVTDITGSNVNTRFQNSLTAIDDNIMRIITLNDKRHEYNLLETEIKNDPNCAMLSILSLHVSLRSPRRMDSKKQINDIFRKLSKLIIIDTDNKIINERERFYAKYLYHWNKGNYFQASLLLESINITLPNDTLAMKLAQDCHIASGNNYGSLTCITRYMPLIGSNHPVRRNLLSVLAHGFVEANMHTDADETSLRAIEMTSEHDLTAIGAYLNSLLLHCKATEASAVIDVRIIMI